MNSLRHLFHTYFNDGLSQDIILEKQRHTGLVYTCVALFMTDIVLWLLGMKMFGDPIEEWVHPIHFIVTVTLFILYLRKKISSFAGLALLCTASQLAIMHEMLFSILYDKPFVTNIILGYMVIAGLNLSLMLMSYIPKLPFLLTVLTVIAYGVCCIATRDTILIGVFPIFASCFLVTALLGHKMDRNVRNMEKEKSLLKENEQKVLSLFDLDRGQLMAYVALAKEKKLSVEQTGELLNVIGQKAQENIRKNVAYYYSQQSIDYTALESRLPMLSPSEIAICDLIVKDKKLKEMSKILEKSATNISSQRSHIRKKLNLQPSDNLRDALVEILQTKLE
ncbi:MAG: hypothetical protein LBV38_03585 [Alistipes sp.]|jgi:DNA-binding CsgD family transcriptional regulator|nr:hypothetical protein [Alistipes sp.]